MIPHPLYFKRPSLIPFSELVWHLRILSSYISVGPVPQLQATYDNKSNAHPTYTINSSRLTKEGKEKKKTNCSALADLSHCVSEDSLRLLHMQSGSVGLLHQAVEIMRYGSHVIWELTGRVSACIIRESVIMPRRRLISQ